jgi:hypothetical protein
VPSGANTFLHWDGSTWTSTVAPGPQELGLRYFYSAISGTSGHDVWAAGVVTSHSTLVSTPQIAHLKCG